MPWSKAIGSGAAWIAGHIAEATGATKEEREEVEAITLGVVGGTTAVLTGDVIGGTMVAADFCARAASKKLPLKVSVGVGVAAGAVKLLSGDVSGAADISNTITASTGADVVAQTNEALVSWLNTGTA
jgi:hypothetical protein